MGQTIKSAFSLPLIVGKEKMEKRSSFSTNRFMANNFRLFLELKGLQSFSLWVK